MARLKARESNWWDLPVPTLYGTDLLQFRQQLGFGSDQLAQILSIKETALSEFERGTSPLPSRLSDRIHTLQKYIALDEVLSKKRGRPRGPTVKTRQRIRMAAAFGRQGYTQRKMAPFLYPSKHLEDAYDDTRSFFSSNRELIDTAKGHMSPAEAQVITDRARQGDVENS